MPNTRMRWTGSAVCLASSRMRSWRSLDGLSPSGRKTPDGQRPGWQVEVFQEEAGRLALAEAMDGDQGRDELGHRAVGPVDGERDGKAYDCCRGDPAGGVAENEPFLLERLE